MTMPMDLMLVRHGKSEGNAAIRASEKSDESYYTPEFMQRHSSLWRLVDEGIEETKSTGAWLRANFPKFDSYYTSEYTRALETAAWLGLEDARWRREFQLRERSHGSLEGIPASVRNVKFAQELAQKERTPFFWTAPGSGAESMANVCVRVGQVIDVLRRECGDKRAIIVCHGEVIQAFRICLEHMPPERWLELEKADDKAGKIFNGQIVHYTRRDPTTGDVSEDMDWMRMIRPDHQDFSREWQPVSRPKFTNEQLLALAQKTVRLVNK